MFKKARLQLTLWYLLIIMLVSLFFSVAIFNLISFEIDKFASRPQFRRPEIEIDIGFIAESKQRLITSLIYQNLIILVVSGSLSYFLAGKTLNPIAKTIEEQKIFISDASHELRTPLTALKSTFEVALRDPKLTMADAKNNLKTGINEVDKLTNLTNSMLRLSHLENGNGLQHVSINLKTISNKVVSRLLAKATAKKIKIINKTKNISITGDPLSIEELFEIIVDNAIKYSSNSTIKINSIKNKIIITDQGLGISQKDLPHIFDRFYRADNARTKSSDGGYGLGLPIAQKIMDKHGGKILVDSKLNSGTTVTLAFKQ
ncbi:MAG: HAMP domain-containing sensor histidine kinase [Candidatus Shapirobacteria bacterium]